MNAQEQLLHELETYNCELVGERDELLACLREWRKEQKTNRHKMAHHAERVINILLAEMEERWPETFTKVARKVYP